ncbi:MAG: hypothetical protein WDZ40_00970 [Candidatus Spechtbacterales bacterium]
MDEKDFREVLENENISQNVIDETWKWLQEQSKLVPNLLTKWIDKDILRIVAKKFHGDLVFKKHMCGSSGFGWASEDYCPLCVKFHNSFEYSEIFGKNVEKDFHPSLFIAVFNEFLFSSSLGLGVGSFSPDHSKKEFYLKCYGLN